MLKDASVESLRRDAERHRNCAQGDQDAIDIYTKHGVAAPGFAESRDRELQAAELCEAVARLQELAEGSIDGTTPRWFQGANSIGSSIDIAFDLADDDWPAKSLPALLSEIAKEGKSDA